MGQGVQLTGNELSQTPLGGFLCRKSWSLSFYLIFSFPTEVNSYNLF